MIKKYYTKILTLLFLVVACGQAAACGGGWDYRGFTLFLNPFQKSQPKYNYLYNAYSFTYNLGYDYYSPDMPSESDILLQEWATFLATKKMEEVQQLVFENNLTDINTMANGKKLGKSFGALRIKSGNSLFKKVYANDDLLAYVQLIQDYSHNVNSKNDEWEYAYHAQQADPIKLKINQQIAEELYTKLQKIVNPTSEFIKPRLAYHLVRSAYFNRQYQKAEAYLSRLAPSYASKSAGIIDYWLEGMRGGVAVHTNQTNKAILHYARIFSQSEYTHYTAYIDLKWLSNEHNLLDALREAANQEDSLSIYAAASATNSKLAAEVFTKNIGNIADEEIRYFLWYREMQKVEETHFHPKVCNQPFERWDEYGEYLKENSHEVEENYAAFKLLTQKLYSTCKNIAYKPHYENGLAYIALMDENYAAVVPNLENTGNHISNFQRIIFSLYKQVRQNKTIANDDVIRLLDAWKGNRLTLEENKQTLNYVLRDFVAPHFLYHQKDTLSALLLWGVSDGYSYWNENQTTNEIIFSNSEVADVLINYTLSTTQYQNLANRIKTSNSPLLLWAKQNQINVSIIKPKENDLLFYKLVRDENWKQAEKHLYTTNLSFKKQKYYNPFLVHYDGYLSPNSLDSSKALMNAHQFLRLGALLKTNVEKTPTAENLMRYGQYLFSTTFHGHNSIADDGDLGYLHSTTYDKKPWFYDIKKFGTYVGYYYFYESFEFEPTQRELDYYHCYKAEKYFEQAYKLLTDREEKAKCCFLLAKCVQKRAPMPTMVKNEYDYMEEQPIMHKGVAYDGYIYHSFTNPYLLEMEKRYADTKAYKEAVSECSYLRYILK